MEIIITFSRSLRRRANVSGEPCTIKHQKHSIFRVALAHSRNERVLVEPCAWSPKKNDEQKSQKRGANRVKVRAVSNSRLEGPWRSGLGPGDAACAMRGPEKGESPLVESCSSERVCCDLTRERGETEEDRVRNNRLLGLCKCLRNDVKTRQVHRLLARAVAERNEEYTRRQRGNRGRVQIGEHAESRRKHCRT